MRPEILFPLFAPVTTLPGVGPRIARLMESLSIARVVDVLWHLPSGLIDRRATPQVVDAVPGTLATITVRVLSHQAPRGPRQPHKVLCADDTGPLTLVFFHAKAGYLASALPVGATRVVSGTVESYGGQAQMTHPDHVGLPEELGAMARVEPIYPLTAGLTLGTMAKAAKGAMQRLPDMPEWLDAAQRARAGWPAWTAALRRLHAPTESTDLDPHAPARERLAYDELLANQLALLLVRRRQRRRRGRALSGDGRRQAAIVTALPFSLTASQSAAVAEIAADMAAPERMLRLLQGDVGSGKTVVALLAMAIAIEAGAQAALMAPTEVLARQHLATIAPLAERAGLRVALLTGRDKGRLRGEVLDRLRQGEIDILVGTHALFQEDVAFRDLALVVIDEQHRFGVHERLLLTEKGETVDTLVMTATPIPRTLVLTAYGDMEVSRLTEKPAGRRAIVTRALPTTRLDEVEAAIARALDSGARVYWVCPMVEESEEIDLQAAEGRARQLEERFPGRVGLLHGRLKPTAKDAAIAAFAAGRTSILVATTVIEVGIDVPEATVIVIEHAERFGLSQLHQLRGRVGRGTRDSYCLLLYAGTPGETARARLRTLCETDDGFRIAEEDLRLRGGGEILGTKQSGWSVFRLADLAHHGDLLEIARDDARLICERDPDLGQPRGAALRVLLYLFERDAAIRFLGSG